MRVGLVRFAIDVCRSMMGFGEVEYCLGLTPQADCYRVLANEWHGLHSRLVEKDVEAPTPSVSRRELLYEMTVAREAGVLRQLSQELADNAVDACLARGLVDFSAVNKAAACYIVQVAVMNTAIKGESDHLQHVGFIDLVPDMRAIREQRELERRELERMVHEAWLAQLCDAEAHTAEETRRAGEARKASFELLFSVISPAEKVEVQEKGAITVRNPMGEFVIPIAAHGLVRRYVDGQYVASYCVVFRDWKIPLGDEALMKYALLKTSPRRFMAAANRFVERVSWTGHCERMFPIQGVR